MKKLIGLLLLSVLSCSAQLTTGQGPYYRGTNGGSSFTTIIASSNLLSVVQTWGGPSNTVTVYDGFNDWFYASATPVSLTNCVGASAGLLRTIDLTISNSSGATFTNFCTIPNAFCVGQNGNNQGTNAITIPATKQGFWHVEVRGVSRTNVYSTVEQ